jgi:ketosteroid isomerase-like protein
MATNRWVLAGLLVCASGVRAADPVEEVRRAETAFAKAFADRDRSAFFAFVLDDASFLSAGRTLAGKAAVEERWSRLLSAPRAPFSWGPERIAVNAAGTVGLSTGPVFDENGAHVGNFSSVWLKQKDGSWRILFDGPGSPAACLAETKPEEGFVTAGDGMKLRYRRVGSGPSTLVVPLGSDVFARFRELADLATVIAYDPRGRSGPASIDADVEDLEAVRRHFALDKIVPVGISSFGLVVALYAERHPEHVARLVQIGPVPPRPDALDLAKVSMPVLTIHGTKDGGAPYRGGREWALSLPNARLVTLEGAAHTAWADDPVGVFGSIREFLRGGWPLGAEKVTKMDPKS